MIDSAFETSQNGTGDGAIDMGREALDWEVSWKKCRGVRKRINGVEFETRVQFMQRKNNTSKLIFTAP